MFDSPKCGIIYRHAMQRINFELFMDLMKKLTTYVNHMTIHALPNLHNWFFHCSATNFP